MRRHLSGFTLIELLITIAVMAIMASLAGPSMYRVIATQRVKATATDLHLALVRTRSEAMKRNPTGTVSVLVKPTTGTSWLNGWQVQVVDTASGGSTTVVQSFDAPKGVTITADLTQVEYKGTGRPRSLTDGTSYKFLVQSNVDGAKVRSVCIESNGRPYVKEANSC